MTVEVPLDLQQYVEDQVATGAYANERDVIADAVRVLRELRKRHDALRQDIQAAIAESKRGESEPLDIDEIKAEGRRRLG
ncbi:MAG TPA: type II toxin-antitoxin system ParD family antitoxin [Phycisphaerae bacterium]|nr:type II toxin-antitoxin system ParD family antitoxin [Phycisphaerae bacterium]